MMKEGEEKEFRGKEGLENLASWTPRDKKSRGRKWKGSSTTKKGLMWDSLMVKREFQE